MEGREVRGRKAESEETSFNFSLHQFAAAAAQDRSPSIRSFAPSFSGLKIASTHTPRQLDPSRSAAAATAAAAVVNLGKAHITKLELDGATDEREGRAGGVETGCEDEKKTTGEEAG